VVCPQIPAGRSRREELRRLVDGMGKPHWGPSGEMRELRPHLQRRRPGMRMGASRVGGSLFLFARMMLRSGDGRTPSPGTPGEGRGEGDFEHQRRSTFRITLTPTLSRSTGRGGQRTPGQSRAKRSSG